MAHDDRPGFEGARFVVLNQEVTGAWLPRVKFRHRDGGAGMNAAQDRKGSASDGEERGSLIERFFPSEAVTEASRKERYQRGKTAHTIFTWWARRPFAAVSGVVVTSLMRGDVQVEQVREAVEGYCRERGGHAHQAVMAQLARPGEQRVLDMFSGGATIPLEAASLGARAYSVDNNELAHFIQRALLQESQRGPQLAALVAREGRVLLEALREETAAFFPARDAGEAGRTLAYVWSRQVRCGACDGEFSLSKRPWLVKRGGRAVHVARRPDPALQTMSTELCDHGEPPEEGRAWSGRRAICPFCEAEMTRGALVEALKVSGSEELSALVRSTGRWTRGRKSYVRAEGALASASMLQEALARDLRALSAELPEVELPQWSGVTNPSLYGLAGHAELFSPRQLAVLVRLCRLLGEHHRRWELVHGAELARALAAFLSGLLDQLVDWNSRLTTWIAQNEQVGRALSGPGIPMVWDFAEIDPTEEGPANLWDKLDRIVRGLKSVPCFEHVPVVLRADARCLPFEDGFFDVVATDPPYFDNLYYNVLADCIFVWKRLALGAVFPELFAAPRTDQSRELTMNRHVHTSAQLAQQHYTRGMTQVLAEVRRVLKPQGVLSMIFAHSTVEAWAAMVQAFDEAALALVAVWPMNVERSQRPRAMRSRAVNTSFVLVGKRRLKEPPPVSWDEVQQRLKTQLHREARALAEQGLSIDEQGRTLFGAALGLLSQAGRPLSAGEVLSWEERVEQAARQVEALVEGFELSRR
ncbi:hypothetical protein DL240_14390 [Lujinxingia litoralis]|uniref:DUF1156 domain-containing protein n=1 Tax=Lujinxingia litoralis TaxID=2211119 RepID=A0A328C4R2_9DELT|nr:DUF1156 domain-containing protein [Lujinxingia litoralis]RAL20870.1 hypothetical protein DL240_14390 [Lujinxingia litoralis]